MNSQSAPASHQDGCLSWTRTKNAFRREINSLVSLPFLQQAKNWVPTTVLPRIPQFWRLIHHFNACGKPSHLVGVENFEISTSMLKASCSASELHTQKSHNKFVTVDFIPLKDTVPSVSAALPITPCSDRSIGILLIIQCLNW
jgi:hypothetical protein